MNSHELPIRIYYADTDAGGVVYHATYLRFAEQGRTEMLRALGHDQAKLLEEKGILFTIVGINMNFRAPARLDDLIVVKSSVSRLGGASMEIQQAIYRDDTLLSELKVTLVCIDQGFKAVRLPEEIRKKFSQG